MIASNHKKESVMKNTRTVKNGVAKKVVGTVVIGAVIATSAIALVGCSVWRLPSPAPPIDASFIYSMSAVTSVEYLASNADVNAGGSGYSTVSDTITTRPDDITDDTMDTIGQFIGMFEGLLIGEGFEQVESTPNVDVDGGYSDYKTKIVVSMPTLSGEAVEYVMYYTETPIKDEVEEVNDEDEVEISTSLMGVIIMDGDVSEISGTKTIETEGAEVETEIEFITKIDENNWVKVSEEKELGEIEYEYTIMTDGVQTVTSIEYKNEQGYEELSLELEDSSGNEVEYSVKMTEKDGVSTFEVEYEDENANTEVNLIITPLTDGKYEYVFKNGHVEIR